MPWFIHLSIRSSTHVSFIHPSSYLWNGFSISDAGGQQYRFFYPVVPDTKWVPGDRPAAAVAVEADGPAGSPHARHSEQRHAHLQADQSDSQQG